MQLNEILLLIMHLESFQARSDKTILTNISGILDHRNDNLAGTIINLMDLTNHFPYPRSFTPMHTLIFGEKKDEIK